jgi:hypothetical protein
MKKLFRTFIAVAVIGSIATLASCTKTCDEGFEGDKCDVEIRAKFLGAYAGNEICTAGSDNYTLTVANSGTDILKITLSNVYGSAFTASASVDGSSFTVPSQTVAVGVTVSGSGTVTGNNLTFTYNINDGTNSNNCTFTGAKL